MSVHDSPPHDGGPVGRVGAALNELKTSGQAFASLLNRAKAVDPGAIGELYDSHLPIVYRTILARVGDVHLAEDLTSETFLAMVDAIKGVRAEDELGFAAWILTIARNKVSEHYRRMASRPNTQGVLSPNDEPQTYAEEGDPLGVVVSREEWERVTAALNQLTGEQRLVVYYRFVQGYDTVEVASKMRREPGAIRGLQFRALNSLARILAKHGTNPPVPVMRRISNSAPSPHTRAKSSRLAPPQRSQPR